MHLHNSLSKKEELLKPSCPPKITLYVCGMTVYDYCHIGHGRIFVVFDAFTRYLRSRNYEVVYVRNITDIDDKIIKRAHENNEPIEALTERFIAAMHEDERALNILPPDKEPRATQHISDIIAMIEQLIAKNHAYVADNGDVCYSVGSFPDYGKFSHQTLEKLRRGARVDILDSKRDPLDFVLWKLAKLDEPSWDSPWGKGRPGWHIECSSMVRHCFGEQVDIHGGGVDLIFPHHQNEIAQSEGVLSHKPFANLWMHVGHVQVDKEKMSKSLGNFFIIRDVLKEYDAEVIRYFMLASHYRSPINYSKENLESAKAGLARLYSALRDLPLPEKYEGDETFLVQFNTAMDDDFNTPVAFSVLFDLVREINRFRDEGNLTKASQLGCLLKQLCDVLGILQKDPEIFLRSGMTDSDIQTIESLIGARNEARNNKQWAEADKLRDQLLAIGVAIEDTSKGTIWRKITIKKV